MRSLWILPLALATLNASWAWGTASSPAEMSEEELKKVRQVMSIAGLRNDEAFWRDFQARRGPHLIHQWIAWQAFELLKLDPAFEGSNFPDIKDINRWDGQFRVPEGWEFLPSGPTERRVARRVNEATRPELNDTAWPEESPGPDAESTRRNRWNPFYNGRAHYWNPWLRIGGAPLEAGGLYVQLVKSLMSDSSDRERARLACYMAHYVGDVASPKHADALVIPDALMPRIEQYATEFMKLKDKSMKDWINSTPVEDTKKLFRMITNAASPGVSDAFWKRVERHIAVHPFLSTGWGPRLAVHPKTLNSSIAVYLESVARRPTLGGVLKPLDRFFNYFDPFYINGEVLHPAFSEVNWAFANPAGEHLYCETNTGMMAFVGKHLGKPIIPAIPKPEECGFTASPAFFDPKFGNTLRIRAMGELVQHCSAQSHGQIEWDFDFRDGVFEGALKVAVRHVAGAFRACITGMRIDARIVGDGSNKYRIRCKFTNVSEQRVDLHGALLSWDSGAVKVTPAPEVSLTGKSLGKGEVVSQEWEIDVPEGSEVPEFTVDLYGLYKDIPDRGWERAPVRPGGLHIARGPAAGEKEVRTGNPLDLVVVFDTSGSMQSSIDNVREQTVETIRRLKTKCPDIRVGLVEYRDFQDAEAPAMRAWEFDTPENQIERMNGFVAKGGGDEPEDQYAALMRAIKMKWRNTDAAGNAVTKLIVLITDASAKKPDKFGNTADKVAKAAFDVDPAHIYPIVVGSASQAVADAQEIADKTSGEMLSAKSGAEVADRLAEAVEKGMDKHAAPVAEPPPPPPPPKRPMPTPVYLIGGGVLALLGAGVLLAGLSGGSGGQTCAKCGAALVAGRKFCTACGATREDRL